MFTGIIQRIGKVTNIQKNKQGQHITIICDSHWLETTSLGDSIATNGTCLSIESKTDNSFTVYSVLQTLHQTNLGNLQIEDFVNLEKAVTLQTPLGGHWVLGHIDGLGKIVTIKNLPDQSQEIDLQLKPSLLRYCIDKGSITINGVSLTLAMVMEHQIRVALIPITLNKTNLIHLQEGYFVNIEVDILGKYIEKLFPHSTTSS